MPGFFNCLKCHSTCASCYGEDETSCLTCSRGYRLYLGSCIKDKCPEGTFQVAHNEVSECLKCHPTCKSCNGPSHKDCKECKSNTTKTSESFCAPCRPGMFLNKAGDIPICSTCHSSCVECNGPTADDCSVCEAPRFLDGSKCVPCCTTPEATTMTPDKRRDRGLISSDMPLGGGDCCKCYNSHGPCISQEHTRSIYGSPLDNFSLETENEGRGSSLVKSLLKMPVAVISAISIGVLILFLVLFLMFQTLTSFGKRGHSKYSRLGVSSTAKYGRLSEKVSLNADDFDDEDCLFEKT